MQSMIQIAAHAARQALDAQALVSNNLANADTTAFKADLYQAQSAYIHGGALESGATTMTLQHGVDFAPGGVTYTGNDLDVAINGEGWFQVINPNGEMVLSRRGDLRIEPDGRLVDGKGNQIMGEGGPIAVPDYSSISVGADGTLSIVPLGEPPNASVALDRLMLVNPEPSGLNKGLDGEVRHPDVGVLPPDASVQLAVGALETSNVNTVAAMVEMIELSRSFETHVRAMKSAKELDTASASLMKLE
jgi:flagellar basal-body rod protein FlgF